MSNNICEGSGNSILYLLAGANVFTDSSIGNVRGSLFGGLNVVTKNGNGNINPSSPRRYKKFPAATANKINITIITRMGNFIDGTNTYKQDIAIGRMINNIGGATTNKISIARPSCIDNMISYTSTLEGNVLICAPISSSALH
jgi:hypothetical protein